jgi:hypothetical protein
LVRFFWRSSPEVRKKTPTNCARLSPPVTAGTSHFTDPTAARIERTVNAVATNSAYRPVGNADTKNSAPFFPGTRY